MKTTTFFLDSQSPSKSRDTSPVRGASTGEAMATDQELVQETLKGDTKAFGRLYLRHKDSILAICLNYSNRDHAQAHDLLQETFIYAFNDLYQLKDGSLFPFWVRRIAINKCISYKRKQKTLASVLRDYEVIKPSEEEREWSAHDLQLIADLIESIKDVELRRTVELYYLEGKHSGEIAKILGITQTAVTTRLNRFRTKFRARIIQDILRLRASKNEM